MYHGTKSTYKCRFHKTVLDDKIRHNLHKTNKVDGYITIF